MKSNLEYIKDEFNNLPELRPTFVLGLGGTGVKGVLHAKLAFLKRFKKIPPFIKFLAIDTTAQVRLQEVDLAPGEEFMNIGGLNLNSIVDAINRGDAEYRNLRKWFPPRLRPGQITFGAMGVRAIGRLLYFHRHPQIRKQYENIITSLTSFDDKVRQEFNVQLDKGIDIHIIASTAGGTGSGMILDAAYDLTKLLENLQRTCIRYGHLVLPEPFFEKQVEMPNLQANSYICLDEIENYMKGVTPWVAEYRERATDKTETVEFENRRRPFDILYLLTGRTQSVYAPLEAVISSIGEMVALFTVSPVGRMIVDSTVNLVPNVLSEYDTKGNTRSYSSYGLSVVEWDRAEIDRLLVSANKLRLIEIMLRGKGVSKSIVSDSGLFPEDLRSQIASYSLPIPDLPLPKFNDKPTFDRSQHTQFKRFEDELNNHFKNHLGEQREKIRAAFQERQEIITQVVKTGLKQNQGLQGMIEWLTAVTEAFKAEISRYSGDRQDCGLVREETKKAMFLAPGQEDRYKTAQENFKHCKQGYWQFELDNEIRKNLEEIKEGLELYRGFFAQLQHEITGDYEELLKKDQEVTVKLPAHRIGLLYHYFIRPGTLDLDTEKLAHDSRVKLAEILEIDRKWERGDSVTTDEVKQFYNRWFSAIQDELRKHVKDDVQKESAASLVLKNWKTLEKPTDKSPGSTTSAIVRAHLANAQPSVVLDPNFGGMNPEPPCLNYVGLTSEDELFKIYKLAAGKDKLDHVSIKYDAEIPLVYTLNGFSVPGIAGFQDYKKGYRTKQHSGDPQRFFILEDWLTRSRGWLNEILNVEYYALGRSHNFGQIEELGEEWKTIYFNRKFFNLESSLKLKPLEAIEEFIDSSIMVRKMRELIYFKLLNWGCQKFFAKLEGTQIFADVILVGLTEYILGRNQKPIAAAFKDLKELKVKYLDFYKAFISEYDLDYLSSLDDQAARGRKHFETNRQYIEDYNKRLNELTENAEAKSSGPLAFSCPSKTIYRLIHSLGTEALLRIVVDEADSVLEKWQTLKSELERTRPEQASGDYARFMPAHLKSRLTTQEWADKLHLIQYYRRIFLALTTYADKLRKGHYESPTDER